MYIQSQIFRDHLGSITGVESRLYAPVSDPHPVHIDCIPNPDDPVYYHFDAFGRRSNGADWGYNTSEEPELLANRGFTGHEHLTEFGLINMNGRLYDPLVGRFLSPDNYVQAPGYTQSYNRYAYCLNNPLRYTDPSGEFVEFLIAGAFFYLKGAHDNRDKTTGKWAWNPATWFGKDQTGLVVGVNTNTDFSNVNYYAGLYSPDYSPVLAYNPDYGMGMGNAVNPGYNTFYYPAYTDNVGAVSSNFVAKANSGSDKVTFEKARLWYQYAGGTPMNVDLNTIDFSRVSMRDINDGLIKVELDNPFKHMTNANDALVYGTLTLQRVNNNMFKAAYLREINGLGDYYNFDVKWTSPKAWLFRNENTIVGGLINGLIPFGGSFIYIGGTPYPIYLHGNVTIKP
ncbi:MAG TPA: RHS repeat-associated core domain-containing protein [Prolixibacteraceae bacterium]|nr:RHS repeat-associated core domain-containing protein [Prolixibacteraceae bacterium]